MTIASNKTLNEKQIKVIELYVEGELPVTEICELVQVPRSTFYEWKKNNKVFKETLEEAIELKVNEAKQRIRIGVNKYINRLEKLQESGKNEQAIVNAIKSLLTLGELDPSFKQEVTINKDESESKNYLLDMLKKEKE